jgi:hypothetical protein
MCQSYKLMHELLASPMRRMSLLQAGADSRSQGAGSCLAAGFPAVGLPSEHVAGCFGKVQGSHVLLYELNPLKILGWLVTFDVTE